MERSNISSIMMTSMNARSTTSNCSYRKKKPLARKLMPNTGIDKNYDQLKNSSFNRPLWPNSNRNRASFTPIAQRRVAEPESYLFSEKGFDHSTVSQSRVRDSKVKEVHSDGNFSLEL